MTIKSFSFLLVFLGACIQWDAPQTLEDNPVALSTNYITPVVDPNSLVPGDPAAKIYEVQAGTTTNKNDIDSNNQKFENKVATLNDVKVDIAGDTMTGQLEIAPSAAATALLINAEATSKGARIDGSANEPALEINGGANTNAVQVVCTSVTAAVEVENGGTGIGINAVADPSGLDPVIDVSNSTAGSGTTPKVSVRINSALHMAGVDPNPTVDPGADNVIHAAAIPKTWVVINDSYVIQDGYNVASVTNVLGSIYQVTFARPMANANYGVKIHVHGAAGYSGCHNGAPNKTVNGFQFVIFKTDAPGTLGFGTATEAFIEVTGRQ